MTVRNNLNRSEDMFVTYSTLCEPMTNNAMNQQRSMQSSLQMQQRTGMMAACQMRQQIFFDGCNLSSNAEALMLLTGMSRGFDFMMNGANFGLPRMSDFGERWGQDPFFNPTGQSQYQNVPENVSPKNPPVQIGGGAKVKPLCQSNGSSCGQTSVAMCVNALTGKKLTDKDINGKYGFGLLNALNSESRSAGYKWTDGGNFSAKNWPSLEKRLNQEKTPVMIGLNGQFSPSGRGHIVTLLSIDGDKVTYADPANGKVKTTTKKAIEQAPPHPDGKFFFYASKVSK